MRRGPLVTALAASVALACAATAWGQSRANARTATTSTLRMSRSAAPDRAMHAPSTLAYLDGRQRLLGLHAPSSDALARDPRGRVLLSLRSVNRGETLQLVSQSDAGDFASFDLDQAAHFMRSATGDEHPIDPRILSIVYRIQTHFAVPEIRMVSGYRTPRPRNHSNHGKGRAMDLIVPGIADEDVARYVREFGFVGVGIYPRSQFVHVDIRPRSYFWVDSSGPHMRNREHAILGGLANSSDAAALARGQSAVEPFEIGTDVEQALRSLGSAAPAPSTDDEEEDDSGQ